MCSPSFPRYPLLQADRRLFLDGQSVFEGMKAFRAKDGSVRIFKPKENARRICHSAEAVSMPPLPEDIFLEGSYMAVQKNLEFVP